MRTIFDQSTREELITRIDTLGEDSQPQWGKMDICQMLKHCITWNEWVLGKNNTVYKQELLGRIFGRIALRGMVKDDKPMKRNMPAGSFAVKEKGGHVETQKRIWTGQVADYAHFSNTGFVHDFFGKVTREEIGILAYKHLDHHLRQFGA